MQPIPISSFPPLTPPINSFTPPQPPPFQPPKLCQNQQQAPQTSFPFGYQVVQNPLLAQYQSIPQYQAYLPGQPQFNTYQPPTSYVCIPNSNQSLLLNQDPNFNLSGISTASSVKNMNTSSSHSSIANATSSSNSLNKQDDLRSSIQIFVKTLENSSKNRKSQSSDNNSTSGFDNNEDNEDFGAQQISTLSKRFSIKRRRLYDVINVFEAIGCCEKSGLDSVRWVGKENIISNLRSLKLQRGVHDRKKRLDDLFPVPCCVGISNLSISFLLLFFALQQNKVDLRYASQFFSRTTARYKTTLCKLYQICYILGSIGVTSRTAQVCEVILNKPYYDEDVLPPEEDGDYEKNLSDNDDSNSKNKHKKKGHNQILTSKSSILKSSTSPIKLIDMSINSLLNHKEDMYSNQYIYDRRKELSECYSEFIKKNDESTLSTASTFV